MSLVKLERLLLRLIIAGSVLWSSFCLIAGGLAWLIVSRSSNHGDDTGLGILCISLPLATLCTIVILVAVEKLLLSRGPAISDDKRS